MLFGYLKIHTNVCARARVCACVVLKNNVFAHLGAAGSWSDGAAKGSDKVTHSLK